ncbi:C4-type zinc ribbon domain-containing protein [Saxibacter everestensis]|uniref:C4-type zinc ribbon domain-containing protein n=1 Tax=Saxibacter everestensis TaxID=2909229 RepID=A0ABY8QYV6_9MICO|nr:C4-type zinc ribbon domain-containing protein [Brevibacteriaceae bacterium ZFBP1038]
MDASPADLESEIVVAKASAADQHALLNVQSLDSKLLQLAHKAKSLPEIADLAKLAERRAEFNERLSASERELEAAASALQSSEQEVAAVQSRIDRNQSRLDTGTGSSKDLTALQTDVAHLSERRGDLELIELEHMEAVEAVSETVDALTQERSGIDAESAELETARDKALSEIESERADVETERASAVAGIDPDLVRLYEKLRSTLDGVGAAALRRNACEGCGQQFSPTQLNEIEDRADDDIVRCEECDRILVRL